MTPNRLVEHFDVIGKTPGGGGPVSCGTQQKRTMLLTSVMLQRYGKRQINNERNSCHTVLPFTALQRVPHTAAMLTFHSVPLKRRNLLDIDQNSVPNDAQNYLENADTLKWAHIQK